MGTFFSTPQEPLPLEAQAASEPGPDGVDIAAPTRVACVGASLPNGSGLPARARPPDPLFLLFLKIGEQPPQSYKT